MPWAAGSAWVTSGGRPSKPESGNGLVLRVTHHKYAAPPIVSTAGTVKSLAGGDSFVSIVPARTCPTAASRRGGYCYGEWAPFPGRPRGARTDRIYAHASAGPRAGSDAQDSQLWSAGGLLLAAGVNARLSEATRSGSSRPRRHRRSCRSAAVPSGSGPHVDLTGLHPSPSRHARS